MPAMDIILILAAGTAAGFLNTVAGGGSLITMPMLIFLGMPSAVANGTNRIALMFQNMIAITNFKSKGFFNWKLGLVLGLPAVAGSVIGSGIAVNLSDEVFNRVLAVVMLVSLILIIFQPHNRIRVQEAGLDRKRKIMGIIIFFFVGVYGGLIQAGIGFIIIAALTLITGLSLVNINSLKVLIVAIYLFSSLIVFIANGKINWIVGITLAAGNGMGAYLGSSLSIEKGDKWIKAVLVVSVIVMSVRLLGLF